MDHELESLLKDRFIDILEDYATDYSDTALAEALAREVALVLADWGRDEPDDDSFWEKPKDEEDNDGG